MLVESEELIAPSDIAQILMVVPSAVSNWINRHENFPAPVAVVAKGKTSLWIKSEVIAWYRSYIGEARLNTMRELLSNLETEGD